MTEDRDVVRLTLAEAEARAAEIGHRLWADEQARLMEGRFVHLEADGRDVEVVTREGEIGWSVILRGPLPGSIEVMGEGQVYAFRAGSGAGHALRTGAGYGEAIREGSGPGWGVRTGDARGSAVRCGSGDGSAEMHGGRGNVFREDSGDGDAWRTGVGIDGLRGGAIRKGTGVGVELMAAGPAFEAIRAGVREGASAAEVRKGLIRAEYRALAAEWQMLVGPLDPAASWPWVPGLRALAARLDEISRAGVLGATEMLAVGSILGTYRSHEKEGPVRQVPRFVTDKRELAMALPDDGALVPVAEQRKAWAAKGAEIEAAEQSEKRGRSIGMGGG